MLFDRFALLFCLAFDREASISVAPFGVAAIADAAALVLAEEAAADAEAAALEMKQYEMKDNRR